MESSISTLSRSSSSATRIPSPFALVIGIDDYAIGVKLRGAVADAKAVKQYLETELRVPENRILTLYDKEATREAIIKAFRDIPKNELIHKGDPIVIFYAGHGGELDTPTGWSLRSKIQCLFPQDNRVSYTRPIRDHITGDLQDDGVSYIDPIPDRTISVLLETIAKEKDDNITVIFDCCHSTSGTRVRDDEYVPRTMRFDHTIPDDLDRNIWGGRVGNISEGFAYHGLRSHVLLAACGEKEYAYEHKGRGRFTSALLETLKRYPLNDLTYTEALEHIHFETQFSQNPHCEGANRHRFLFDTRLPAGRRVFYPVRAGTGGYVIGAGLAHGVSHGTEFTLYCNRKRLLGSTVLVDSTSSIDEFETTLEITGSVDLTNLSFAKITRIGNVPLYLTPGGNNSVLEETLLRMKEDVIVAQKFHVVEEIEKAKLEIAVEDNRAVFKNLDQLVKTFGLTELPSKVDLGADSFPHILAAAAHYFWYLDLENKKNRLGSGGKMAVDFYRLKRGYDKYGDAYFDTIMPGFCRKDPNLGNSDIIDFVVEPNARYGIKITNNILRDLYLNAFLFNTSSLSIVPYYTQSTAGTPEAPLKKLGGTFTLGYGSGGSPPFSFSLEKGQDVDIGYLKIFFATRPIDLSDIEQMSPFLSVHPPLTTSPREGGPGVPKPLPGVRHIWFTMTIPVVQRKAETHA